MVLLWHRYKALFLCVQDFSLTQLKFKFVIFQFYKHASGLTSFPVLRLAAMKRELKVKELNLIDATKRRFLSHQQDQRRIQLQRLDYEIQKKVVLYLFPLYFFCYINRFFYWTALCKSHF